MRGDIPEEDVSSETLAYRAQTAEEQYVPPVLPHIVLSELAGGILRGV